MVIENSRRQQTLDLNEKIISGVIKEFRQAIPLWNELIHKSFLSQSMQEQYLQLLRARGERLGV